MKRSKKKGKVELTPTPAGSPKKIPYYAIFVLAIIAAGLVIGFFEVVNGELSIGKRGHIHFQGQAAVMIFSVFVIAFVVGVISVVNSMQSGKDRKKSKGKRY